MKDYYTDCTGNQLKKYCHIHYELLERVKRGETEKFQKFLKDVLAGGYPIDFVPIGGPDLLDASLCWGEEDIALMLVKAGSPVNKNFGYGTALIRAAWGIRSLDLWEELLARTKNVNYVYRTGHTALGILCDQYVDAKKEDGEREKLLNMIKLALKYGAEPEKDTIWLTDMVSNEHKKIVAELRENLFTFLATYQNLSEQAKKTTEHQFEYEI